MPFADYKDFKDCVAKNSDKKDPEAYCATIMRATENMHGDFQRIMGNFVNFFKDGSGLERFLDFVAKNNFDVAKPYLPAYQLMESFQWVQPLIEFYRMDKDAKYYKVRALTANVSMNNSDYSDSQKLGEAASTMKYKPINLNHDHSMRLPFPRTRTEVVNTEDMALELLMRVDNQDKRFQMQLDHDSSIPKSEWINYPSVEVWQTPSKDLRFVELACLEVGAKIPGDPLTEIVPLIMNESMRSSIVGSACRIVDGGIVCDSGINGESLNENESKGNMKMTEEKTVVNVAEHCTVMPQPPIDSRIVVLERESALKDRKIAEQAQLIKEAMDKVHTLTSETLEQKSHLKTRDESIDDLNKTLMSEREKSASELKEQKETNRREVDKLSEAHKDSVKALQEEYDECKARAKREKEDIQNMFKEVDTKRLDLSHENLNLQNERNEAYDREKKAYTEMQEALNDKAKTSEKFANLQMELSEASKKINEANTRLAQESKDKQTHIDKLTQLEQDHNKTTALLKQAIRKMAEAKQYFQEPDGTILTDKDVQ